MAERRATMIRKFTFLPEDYSGLTLSDLTKIRVDTFQNCVTLKPQADGFYPTTADLYVQTPIASPTAIRSFIGFQASIKHLRSNGNGSTLNVQITGEGFRLHDGTSQYWWNGAAWVVNTSSWNTEAQVAANIAAFAQGLAAKKFGVVINITTTDKTVTPQVSFVKVAFEVKQHSWIDDIFTRSLVRDLSANVRPIADVMGAPLPLAQNTVDVGNAVAQCGVPFQLVGVDSIFNEDADPNLTTNLLSSYNATTKVATLTGQQPVGANLRVQIIYKPQVIVLTTNPDYVELDQLPSIVIEQIRTVGAIQIQQEDGIVNKSLGTAKQLSKPYTADLDFDIRAIAPGSVDLLRLVEQLVEFADNFSTVRSESLDEPYRLQITDEFDANVSPQASGVCEATASFRIHNVTLLKHSAVDTFAIKRVVVTEQTQQQSTPAAATVADSTTGAPPLGDAPQQ